MSKSQGIKVNLNIYKIKQISLWLAHWALLKTCVQVCYILDKLTEIGFRYIFCFPEDGNDIAITFSVRNKQTNKETEIYMKRLVIAICLESMQYSETLPYGHCGNTAVWSLRYLAPFLAAWQNGNTFSCKKTLINKVIH